jgi:UDPglucose 6-dehydrogenase
MEQARPLMPGVTMCANPYDAIVDADAIAIVTEWDVFRALDLNRVKQLAKQAVLVDLRNIYQPDDVRSAGFEYTSIGRG